MEEPFCNRCCYLKEILYKSKKGWYCKKYRKDLCTQFNHGSVPLKCNECLANFTKDPKSTRNLLKKFWDAVLTQYTRIKQ